MKHFFARIAGWLDLLLIVFVIAPAAAWLSLSGELLDNGDSYRSRT